MERKRHPTLAKCRISPTKQTNDLLTFGIGRGSEGVKRAYFNVDYIASHELGDLARLGWVLDVEFTYVLRWVQYTRARPQLHTLDDISNSWARVVCGDRLAGMNFTESRHQVVRFVGREAFVEPVELNMFVVFMWTALDSSLRNFDML
jgi:hypothetical protein